MARADRGRAGLAILALAAISVSGAAPAADIHPEPPPGDLASEVAAMLGSLHQDFAVYIRAVRIIGWQEARVSPEAVYSGIVRPGGIDPRVPEDAPLSGRGARNDIVLMPAALDPQRGRTWVLLLLDHEYYHARHLGRGWRTPLVDFGDSEANHAYYEATAWSYVLERALAGIYGPLPPSDIREVRATYRRHLVAIRAVIAARQPSAWAHYGRFFFQEEASRSGRPDPLWRSDPSGSRR